MVTRKQRLMAALLGGASALLATTSVNAVPELQLDAEGGAYVSVPEETVFVAGDEFVIYALADKSKTDLADSYFLSISVVPQTGPTDIDFGSFDYKTNSTDPTEADTTIAVTADMTYGIPPLEGFIATKDGGDLGGHGIFDTFFLEIEFKFDASRTTTSYNSQDDPGGTAGGLDDSGDDLYYMPFSFDTSLLVDAFGVVDPVDLHFDLYSIKTKNNGDEDILKFAPFSHDAQTGPGPGPGGDTPPGGAPPFGGVPEPVTATLGVMAMGALSTTLRRRR